MSHSLSPQSRKIRIVLLLCAIGSLFVGGNWFYKRNIAYRVDMGVLPDNQASRVLLLKAFGQALRSNRTAKYVGLRWTFSSGELQGRPLEVGYERGKDNLRFFVHQEGQYCGVSEGFVLATIVDYTSRNPLPSGDSLDFEHPIFWDAGCLGM